MKRQLLAVVGVMALLVAPSVTKTLGGTIDVSGTWVTAATTGDGPLFNTNTNHPIVGDQVDDPSASSNAADNEELHSPFPAITLANAGDSIQFSGTMLMQGSVNSAASSATPRTQFRFGLFKDNGNVNNTGWLGYLMTNAHGNGTPSGTISQKNTGNTSTYLSTTGATALASTNGNGTPFNDDTYALTLSIARAANGDLNLSGTIAGTATTNFTQSLNATVAAANVVTYAFDRLGFLLGGNLDADRGEFSSLQITSNLIPEPSAVALIGLCAVFGGLARQRRLS